MSEQKINKSTGKYGIPEVNYTLNDVKNTIKEIKKMDVNDLDKQSVTNIERITVDYQVTPHFEGEYFTGYDYSINNKKYIMRLNTPIIKSRIFSIEGYDIDLFIKNQMNVAYRGPKMELQEYSYFFGIPNPIFFLPEGEPGLYTHLEPFQYKRTLCKYERGSDGILYRHGLGAIYYNGYKIIVNYHWGLLSYMIVTVHGTRHIFFYASFNDHGYAEYSYFNFPKSLVSFDTIFLYSFNGPSLNGPAWCYLNESYLITSMRNGIYHQFAHYSGSRGTFTPLSLYPIPVLFTYLTNPNEVYFPYNQNSWQESVMGILDNNRELSYRLIDGSSEGSVINMDDITYIIWHTNTHYGDSDFYDEQFSILNIPIEDILVPPLRKIIRDYFYGEEYPTYLKMILNDFGDKIKVSDITSIKRILNTYYYTN
ncbi:MAG: hypothetical protein Solumvirus2_66 [Solumvirus sp.]|uniref:Uncharacterized protein n=1 Tax=Solumvirus sp. TaxID=2487773 RepID=A0A3G5AKB6_9VIRU|nr:MAG: hypothetical protein Solumvirus2_66 [Solumvirus sp.]